jgi:tetratricopeptide (TPR) repeat protein
MKGRLNRTPRIPRLTARSELLAPLGVVDGTLPAGILIATFVLFAALLPGCADQKKQAEGLVRVAIQHRENDRHAEAIQVLNRAIALDPRIPEALYLRGLSHAFLEHQRESIVDLTAAVRQKPGWGAAWTALGVSQEASGETALAIKSFSEAIKLNAREVDARFDRAGAYEKLGEREKALDDLNSLLRLKPDHDDALVKRASFLSHSKPDECIADLSTVIDRNRNNTEAWLLRGICWRVIQDFDRSLADLNMACRLQSGDYRPWLERGRALLELQRSDDAISDLSEAEQLSPSNAECRYQLALAFHQLDNVPAMEANLRKAIELDPAHAPARLALAELNASLGNHEEALAQLQDVAVEYDGKKNDNAADEDVAFRLQTEKARLLAATGKDEDALRELNELLNRKPADAATLQLRAEVLHRLNRTQEAVEDYSRLISVHATPEAFLLERARLQLQSGQLDKAMLDASAVLEKQPDHVDALQLRGELYEQQGLTSLAIADLTQAIQQAPQNSELLIIRSRLFDAIEEPNAATSDLQKALDCSPSNEDIVTNLVSRLTAQDDLTKAVEVIDRSEKLLDGTLSDTLRLMRADLKLRRNDASGAMEDVLALSEDSASLPMSRIMHARAAIALKRYPEAIKVLSGISEDKVTGEVLLLKGQVLTFSGDLEAASTALEECVAKSPDNVDARLLSIRVADDLSRWDSAIANAGQLLDSPLTEQLTEAQLGEALKLRGTALFRRRHFQDALDDLDRIEVRQLDSPSLQWMRASCFHELGQSFRAREELNVLLQAEHAHPAGRKLRARLAEENGEFDIAIKDLSVLLEASKGDLVSDNAIRMQRGLLLHRRGRFEEAIADFTSLIDASPETHEIYYRRGLARHQSGQTEEAITDLDQCLKIRPDFVDAIYVKGNIAATSGKVEEAIQLYREATRIAPSHTASWYNEGNLLFNQDKLFEAIACWTQVIELQPSMFRAWNNRAAAYAKLGKEADAQADYERALALNPGFVKAWDNLAWLLATSENPEIRDAVRAVTVAKKACELTDYKDWSCISTLAAAYAEAGDMEQAASWAKQSREIAPDEQHSELDQLVQTYESRRLSRRSTSTATRHSNGQRN